MQKRYEEYWLGWKPKNKNVMRFNPNKDIYIGRNDLSRSDYPVEPFEYKLSDFKNVKISLIN